LKKGKRKPRAQKKKEKGDAPKAGGMHDIKQRMSGATLHEAPYRATIKG